MRPRKLNLLAPTDEESLVLDALALYISPSWVTAAWIRADWRILRRRWSIVKTVGVLESCRRAGWVNYLRPKGRRAEDAIPIGCGPDVGVWRLSPRGARVLRGGRP